MRLPLAILTLVATAAPVGVAAAPTFLLSHAGRLNDAADAPVNETQLAMTFRFFEVSAAHLGETAIWEDTYKLDVVKGIYSVSLGSGTKKLAADMFPPGADRFLEVTVGDKTLSPRLRFGAMPVAINSLTLEGKPLADLVQKSELAESHYTRVQVDTLLSDLTTSVDLRAKTSDVNTSLALKADQLAVNAALAKKADQTGVDAALGTKADQSSVDTSLALKADKTDLTTALGLKADKTDLTTALGLKADKTDLTTALGLKADKTDVTTSLGLKADKTDLTTALGLKADKTELTTALGLKADKTDVTTSLALKADKSAFDDLNANVYRKTDTYASLGVTGGVTASSFKVIGTTNELNANGLTLATKAISGVSELISPNPLKITALSGAPFDLGSNSFKVPNLNADLIDGLDSSVFAQKAATPFPGTVIMTAQEGEMVNAWVGNRFQTWTLCYRKSTHGNSSSTFHSNCNGLGQTVTVASLSTGKKIGGYSSCSWTSRGDYGYLCGGSFIFSLSLGHVYPKHFYHLNSSSFSYLYWIYDNVSYGPTWGGGHDLYINGSMTGGYCNLGHDYTCRKGVYADVACQNDFCGSYNSWSIIDLEVWYVNN